MKARSSTVATICLGMLLAVPVQLLASQTNDNTTIQVGQVNINRTSQCGDTNTNSTYQEGRVNINQTHQGACAKPERGAKGKSSGREIRGAGRPAHAAAGQR